MTFGSSFGEGRGAVAVGDLCLRIFELKLDLNRRKAAAACPTGVTEEGKRLATSAARHGPCAAHTQGQIFVAAVPH
jgi:hypothetical protein